MARAQDVAGNSFNNALNIGTFKNRTYSVKDSVGKSDSNDYFRLKIASTSVSVISLTNLSADADLEIYYNGQNNPATFTRSGTDSEVAFDDNAPGGTYYVRVLPGSTREADYTLTIHVIALPRSSRALNTRSRQLQTKKLNLFDNSPKPEKTPKRASLWT